MIEYISFDLGAVVIKPGTPDKFYQKIDEDYGMPPVISERAFMAEWDRWNRGEISMAEYWAAFDEVLGVETDKRDLTDFLFNKDAPDEEVLDLMQRLKKRYGVGAITNVPREWYDHHNAKFGVRGWFDHVVVSSYLGAVKPEQAPYFHLTLQANLEPANIVHIDDLKKNVNGARRAGMKAIQYVHNKQLEHELRELGLEF